MKVAIYQTSPILLDLKSNLEDVIAKIRQGREKGAQLIVFPELALTGYFFGQRYHEVALRLDSKEIKQLVSATEGTAAVVGFIEESPSMNFYNSALVMVDGNILFTYRKLNLPNYGVFEERKYFAPGKQIPVFRLGVVQKADVFVTIFNSSQGSMGTEFSNIESWTIINTFYSRIFGIYNICANRVGEESFRERRAASGIEADQTKSEEDSPVLCETTTYRFWGGSEIINPFGHPIAKADLYKQDEIFGEISRDLLRQKKILLPYLRNDDPYFTYRELQRILHDKSRVDIP
ncbi:MAG: nitrilase [Deltaproteobacteria bacterium]|nr:nitrilase [Deltaproteobacteria bacterium]